jgi:outer membrane protein assembly factor BamA
VAIFLTIKQQHQMNCSLKSPQTIPLLSIAFSMFLLFSGGQHCFAQSTPEVATAVPDASAAGNNEYKDSTKTKPAKKYDLSPVPVIAVNPTTGLLGGLLLGVNFKMGDPALQTRTSAFLVSAYYTSNNQLFTAIRGNAFTEENKLFLSTDIRFNLNSQPTYGLGSNITLASQTIVGDDGEVSDDPYNKVPKQEMMAFNNFRFYQTVQKRLNKTNFYYGLGYHLDVAWAIDDKQLDLDAVPPAITFHHDYQTRNNISTEKYTLSGVSLNATFDTRDNVINPYEGQFAFMSFRALPEFLGSTSGASQLWLEYRNYFNLKKDRPRNLLAVWTYGWFQTGGTTPYLYLPALGWDMFARSGRPYTQGRFRGEDVVYGEAEWRFPLQKTKDKWGGVLFLNGTTATNRAEEIGIFNYMQFGYGGGLRFMLNEKNRANIGLDYGFGAHGAQGIFLNLNEYF